jgi:uncharacterized DUF497 family protein
MDFVALYFDWDSGNRDKCEKHGVRLADIETLFSQSIHVFPDPVHSGVELRFKAIGRNAAGRYIFIVFTFRQREAETLVRPISARYMHENEVRHYERQAAEIEKASRSQD